MQLAFDFSPSKPKWPYFPTIVFDPLKSTDFPFCVEEGRVLWGVPNARREFLIALDGLRDEYTANRAAWLVRDLNFRLGGLGGIW
jgi:hypothetical protein